MTGVLMCTVLVTLYAAIWIANKRAGLTGRLISPTFYVSGAAPIVLIAGTYLIWGLVHGLEKVVSDPKMPVVIVLAGVPLSLAAFALAYRANGGRTA